MRKIFTALSEPLPGPGWQADFRAYWPRMRDWFLSEGLEARPTAGEIRTALTHHMPELVGIWERLCRLAGEDDVAHRFLGLYGRPRIIGRCSQAVWLGQGGPALLRNYDFEPARMMGRSESGISEIYATAAECRRVTRGGTRERSRFSQFLLSAGSGMRLVEGCVRRSRRAACR